MDVSVLLVGHGDVADALLAGLEAKGHELERCELDEVCPMAQALAAELVIVVESAGGADSRAVVERLGCDRSTAQIAVLALGATLSRNAAPAHVGSLAWLGSVGAWVEATTAVLERLPLRGDSLQALGDPTIPASRKRSPAAAPAPTQRSEGTWIGMPPAPLGLRAPAPPTVQPVRGRPLRPGAGTLPFPPAPSGAADPTGADAPRRNQLPSTPNSQVSTVPPPQTASAPADETPPTLRPSGSSTKATRQPDSPAPGVQDPAAYDVDVDLDDGVADGTDPQVAPDPTTLRPGVAPGARARGARDRTPLAWTIDARQFETLDDASPVATEEPSASGARRWPAATAGVLLSTLRSRTFLAVAGTALGAGLATLALLRQPPITVRPEQHAAAHGVAVAASDAARSPAPASASTRTATIAAHELTAHPASAARPPGPAQPSAAPTSTSPTAAKPAASSRTSLPSSARARRAFANGQIARGHALLKRGDDAAAEAAYRKALEAAPETPAATAGLARVYLSRGDAAGAVQWAQRAVASKRRSGTYQLLLGDALALHGRNAEARSAWQRAARYGNRTARQRLTATRAKS